MTTQQPKPLPPSARDVTIGRCRLICADALQVLPTFSDFASVATDPPYGIGYKSGHATDRLWSGGRKIKGDKSPITRDALLPWLDDRPALIFGTWRAPRPHGVRQVLIWDKGGALGMGALDIPWKPDHEEIYVLGKGFLGTRDCGSVIRCPPVQSMAKNGRVHPTQKPVRLLEEICRKLPWPILDPFMGSGSTGIACIKLGYPFIGIEADEGYFEIACKRISEATAQAEMFTPAGRAALKEMEKQT